MVNVLLVMHENKGRNKRMNSTTKIVSCTLSNQIQLIIERCEHCDRILTDEHYKTVTTNVNILFFHHTSCLDKVRDIS